VSSFHYHFEPGRSADTLLLLHGTGGNETDLLDIGHSVMPDAALLSPRGRVLENGMPRFFRRLAEGVFDVEDVKFRAKELGEFIKKAAREHGFDAGRLLALGYSNGANIAAAMLLTGAARFPKAVLLRPMVPLQPDRLPDLSGDRILLARGLYDPLATAEQSIGLRQLFESAGATVGEQTTRAGHQLSKEDLEAAARWLAP
jgi:predicted esterase